MRELDDLKYNCTRRHFLSKTSLGIGALGLASLLDPALLSGETGPGPGDAAGPLLQATHFVPRAKRVIYLFQSGGPSQLELFDYKPQLQNDERRGAAGVGANGAAADRHDRVPAIVPHRRLPVRVRAARQVGRLGQRAAASHGEDRRRAVHHQVDAHGGHQPRSRGDVLPDRIAAGGPAVDRLLAVVRHRIGQQQSAGVHRAALARPRGRSAALFVAVGQRVPAVAAPGRAVPRRQGSGSVSVRSGWHEPDHPAPDARHAARARSTTSTRG